MGRVCTQKNIRRQRREKAWRSWGGSEKRRLCWAESRGGASRGRRGGPGGRGREGLRAERPCAASVLSKAGGKRGVPGEVGRAKDRRKGDLRRTEHVGSRHAEERDGSWIQSPGIPDTQTDVLQNDWPAVFKSISDALKDQKVCPKLGEIKEKTKYHTTHEPRFNPGSEK